MTLTIEGIDLSDSEVYVTFVQYDTTLTKKDDGIAVAYKDGRSTVSVFMSQEETGMFRSGKEAKVQVNYIDAYGNRHASRIRGVNVENNLLEEVL